MLAVLHRSQSLVKQVKTRLGLSYWSRWIDVASNPTRKGNVEIVKHHYQSRPSSFP